MPAPTIPNGYAEHRPPPELASVVECFWARRVDVRDERLTYRVLPDGCVDIIFAFDAAAGPSAMGVGAMTRPLVVSGVSPALTIGVRFRPGFAHAALGVPATELTDETVAWSLLARDAEAELERVGRAASDAAKLGAVTTMIVRRFAGIAVPAAVGESVRRIVAADGMLRIAALAPEIGVSRQQLARLFAVHVGVAPKVFARVMRVRAAIARADAARAANPYGVDWSAVAYDLGYYDQPHLVDEFKAITGLTPGAWSSGG